MDADSKQSDFLAAQADVYDQVRRELTAGRKRSHWIWFIFPQLIGLGHSSIAKQFGIASLDEARSYFQHPILGAHLKECVQLLLDCPSNDITAILGSPDDIKFRSCLTLFNVAVPTEPLFQRALAKFYDNQPDPLTIELIDS